MHLYELGGRRMKWMVILVVAIAIFGGWLGYKAWERVVPDSNGWHTANEEMRLLLQKQSEEKSEKKSEEKGKKPGSTQADGKTAEGIKKPKPGADKDGKPETEEVIPAAALNTDGAKSEPSSSTSSIPATPEKENGKIQLNKATAAQLITIPGIGESKANAILAYRKQIGRFQSIEQLLDVKGIGDKLLEKMKPYLAIES